MQWADRGEVMTREEATKLIDFVQGVGSANNWNMLDKLLYLIELVEKHTVKAMPKDAEPVAIVRIHKTGGNAGLSWHAEPVDGAPLMRDGTKLYTHPPKPDPRRAELVRRIDLEIVQYGRFTGKTMKDIRDYLEGK